MEQSCMRPRAPLDAPGLWPPRPGLPIIPLDDGLAMPFDAGLPFSIPLDWKGLPIKLFLELIGLMLSLLLLDTDLPLL